ncbi:MULTISPECIES: alpha-E domain-containing protein [Methylobacterium]|uniref:alpha-E domain-containing protein n=1 Tax=Methylobacterium TaxID=407 RepID=UPI00104AEB66|nr:MULTISPECIES: alpha-E domain-containing protein [Methylobacterium]MDR7037879.1 putative alpha-E superfamily protein [Methylobacterium sp. BE186]
MLSRTADNLYWLSRYVERAEFVARILDAAHRLASLPTSYGGGETNEWASALASAGDTEVFKPLYDGINADTVSNFLAFSPHNPSSIRSCIEMARENARSVRTALTTEMWDTINGAWLELRNYEGRDLNREDFSRFLDWVKGISLTFDGSAYRTMLRNDAYWFTRLGTGLERADNTARILDVKYQILLPAHEKVGGSLDYFQWTTILREVSAFNAYHWVYRESIKPLLVADLLILNRQMPRSFANCYGMIVEHLDLMADAYGRRGASQRLAGNLLARLESEDIDRIFTSGLHEFVTVFIGENNRVGAAITEQYLV